MLRLTRALAVAGLLLVLLGGSTPVALVGALLWGAGAALGFPVGMSAAATTRPGPRPGSRWSARSATAPSWPARR